MAAPPTNTTLEILQNAGYHAGLYQALSEVDYAASALENHQIHVKDLEAKVTASEERVEVLAKITKKERKEHESIRDSKARKFVAKLGNKMGKFEENKNKEEREYVEALQNEMEERDRLDELKRQLASASATTEELKLKDDRCKSLKAKIDALYSSLFDGPTEAFPDEDRLEYSVYEDRDRLTRLEAKVKTETRAAELLTQAAGQMGKCNKSMQAALDATGNHMWSSGGGVANAEERHALKEAKAQEREAAKLLQQARALVPAIESVDRVSIAEGSYAVDDWNSAQFSQPDPDLHEKVEVSAKLVKAAYDKYVAEKDAATKRAEDVKRDCNAAAQTFEARQKELFDLRKAIFESVVASSPKPPGYGERAVQN